jgi:glucose-1-phosphate thymidylyltransferase
MKTIILAAGYSTRLRPLTDRIAKPLLPIGSATILDLILEKVLQVESIESVLVVANAKFYPQFEEWRKQLSGERIGQRSIELLNDGTLCNETRLGAMGDIALALDKVGYEDDVLIIAGDNLFEGNLQPLLDLRKERDASVLGVHKFLQVEDVRRKFGVVTLASDGRVLQFEEKPEFPQSTMAATAIYLLRRADLQHVIALNRSSHHGELNAGTLVCELLAQGKKVYGFNVQSWYDIGTQEDLAKARQHFSPGSV